MGGFALDVEAVDRLRWEGLVLRPASLHNAIWSLGLDLEVDSGSMIEILVKELMDVSRNIGFGEGHFAHRWLA
jgi:hypothetical protein